MICAQNYYFYFIILNIAIISEILSLGLLKIGKIFRDLPFWVIHFYSVFIISAVFEIG